MKSERTNPSEGRAILAEGFSESIGLWPKGRMPRLGPGAAVSKRATSRGRKIYVKAAGLLIRRRRNRGPAGQLRRIRVLQRLLLLQQSAKQAWLRRATL